MNFLEIGDFLWEQGRNAGRTTIDGLSGEEERKAVNAVRYDQPLVDDDTHLQYYENVIVPHNETMSFKASEAYQANTD